MNFPYYIAKRYLFSKKKTNIINIISGIAVAGVAVATMALVIVLSVFNGFHDLVASFLTNFDPQLEVVPTAVKDIDTKDSTYLAIKNHNDIDIATETVEDMALAMYNGKQAMVMIKGVDDNFAELTHIRQILYGDGDFELHAGNLQYGVIGVRLAQTLDIGSSWQDYLYIYAPQRHGQIDMTMISMGQGFTVDSLRSPGVVFAVNQSKYDSKYIITSIDFARSLLGMENRAMALELRVKQNRKINDVKKELQQIAGNKFKVLDRFEQQADTFKIMNIEKMIAYLFLTFILIVACFNIIGALSMLIIDKKDDVVTLRNLGATDKQISRVFMFEGRMISVIGAIIGIVVGLVLCWLQQEFGFVSLGKTEGNFVINAYPVSVHYWDIVLIFVTVIIVGWMAVWYPVRYLSKKFL